MDFNGLEQSWWYRNKRPQTAARVLAHCPKAHRTSAGTAVRLLQLVASWSSIQPGLALETSGTNMQLKPPPEILPWGLRWFWGGRTRGQWSRKQPVLGRAGGGALQWTPTQHHCLTTASPGHSSELGTV